MTTLSVFRLTRQADPFTNLASDLTVESRESAMKFNKSVRWVIVVVFALGIVPTRAFAQPGSFGGGYGPALKVVPPQKMFSTADEQYKYLFDQAKGGTK